MRQRCWQASSRSTKHYVTASTGHRNKSTNPSSDATRTGFGLRHAGLGCVERVLQQLWPGIISQTNAGHIAAATRGWQAVLNLACNAGCAGPNTRRNASAVARPSCIAALCQHRRRPHANNLTYCGAPADATRSRCDDNAMATRRRCCTNNTYIGDLHKPWLASHARFTDPAA